MKKLLFILMLAAAVSLPAENFDKGMEAYTKSNYPEASRIFGKTCDGGDAEGCYMLGKMHLAGKGVPKDASKAVGLLKKSCDGGSGGGCYSLGVMHRFGQGVKQDPAESSKLHGKAAELLKKSCDGGSGQSCYTLGRMYFEGAGPLKRSPTRAKELYHKACGLNHQKACEDYDAEFNLKKR